LIRPAPADEQPAMTFNVRAEFELPLDPPDGICVLGDDFQPVEVILDETAVSISPVIRDDLIDEVEDEEGFLRPVVESFLVNLRATISQDFPGDYGGKLDPSIRSLLREPAEEALRRVARHLRSITGNFRINVEGRGISATYFVDGVAQKWLAVNELNWDEAFGVYDEEWQRACNRAREHARTPLLPELLLDARAFRYERNYRMALLSSAVACEVLLVGKMAEALTASDDSNSRQVDRFAQAVGKADAVIFLSYFYDISPEDIDRIVKTFDARNNLLHNRHYYVTALEANEAIAAATLLAGLERSPR
jgi:hypothetical protein